MISVGNKEVTAIRVGERVVATVYIGARLVWQAIRKLFRRGLLARWTNPGAERMAGNG
ncbi:hypothetical protein [Phocaeicola vulgatus]|uniref:hypothetical protein n=1 Tax=Phocaeicola vulgatus TaxID=821 RepID=UPI00211EBD5B|nr:hypothetical protein [Phocaeicola vulgatus]